MTRRFRRGKRVVDASIGSLLLGSSQVDAMKLWYRRAFDTEENEMGAFAFGSVQLFIEEHSEVRGATAEPPRLIINLDVTGCMELAEHLRDLGTTFVRPVEHEPFGLIATITDPDGNYLQLIEWGATPEAHRG